MHQRRLLIGAALDMLTAANQSGLPDGPNANIGARLVGKLDMGRVGLMGPRAAVTRSPRSSTGTARARRLADATTCAA